MVVAPDAVINVYGPCRKSNKSALNLEQSQNYGHRIEKKKKNRLVQLHVHMWFTERAQIILFACETCFQQCNCCIFYPRKYLRILFIIHLVTNFKFSFFNQCFHIGSTLLGIQSPQKHMCHCVSGVHFPGVSYSIQGLFLHIYSL